ncbi:GPI anchored dioxygenase-like protein [Phyllosticta citribraziliensis]|uniref:GPI anchored dioxygenase-like protein n=1 Tax=Phyllosticta citribraziliensis TaxID=989973 RepID=A0ABR1M159_9PEZI
MVRLSAVAALAALSTLAAAHPEPHHNHAMVKREVDYRNDLANKQTRSLEKCAGSQKMKRHQQRAVERRAATLQRLRKERGVSDKKIKHRRTVADLQAFEEVNHNKTGVVSTDVEANSLFGANTSCILTPENTIGPYFVTGEYVRSDVTEGQAGVPLHLEMQFIDTNTCEPLPDLFIDIWACNSTGVYSGIDASSGQGGLNTTFLRGVQETNSEGLATFDTVFPGHYEGRATHEHVVAHVGAKLLANGTSTQGTVAHIGQLFFDETLREAVEATYPYNTNTIDVTTNLADMWAPYQAENNYDPFPEFVYVNSEKIEDGLLAWISIGVDSTANRNTNATNAAYYDAAGGHDSGKSVAGGGGSGSAPSGSAPAGASGTPSA